MRYARTLLSAFALLLFLAACTTQTEGIFGGGPSLDITTLALEATTIDFEANLTSGDIVGFVDATQGMSGTDAGGFVGVFGTNPNLPAQNTAMIFDATCSPGGTPADCSGGDGDLFNPAFGNVLIISEDLDPSDPDDADVNGEVFEFDFSTWGDGTVVIGQLSATVLDYLDIDGTEGEDIGAFVRIFAADASLLAEFPILATGDGGQDTVTTLVNHAGVARMTVALQGSGAIDNITIATDIPGGGEGCTPGYWRQDQHFDSWVGHLPGDDFETTFGVDLGSTPGIKSNGGQGGRASYLDPATLLDAVWAQGGEHNALARHAVAALLNATSPSVDYLYSAADVIDLVQEAFASGQFEGIKNLLATQNEMGCSLN